MKKRPVAIALSALTTVMLSAMTMAGTAQASPGGSSDSVGVDSLSSNSLGSSSMSSGEGRSGGHSPRAQAAQLVTMGDSFTANGHVRAAQLVHSGVPQELLSSSGSGSSTSKLMPVEIGVNGCGQDPQNWPRLLAEQTNRSLADYSCNAAKSSNVVEDQLDQAIRDGALGAETQEVIVAVGGMDLQGAFTGGLLNFPMPFPQKLIDDYNARFEHLAARVREVAPNARITLPSYLSISDEASRMCLINVIPNRPLGLVVPGASLIEEQIANVQRDAANRIGARFVDVQAATKGHGTCAPDAQRYVSAVLVDRTAPKHTMTMHPTVEGSRAIARELAK